MNAHTIFLQKTYCPKAVAWFLLLSVPTLARADFLCVGEASTGFNPSADGSRMEQTNFHAGKWLVSEVTDEERDTWFFGYMQERTEKPLLTVIRRFGDKDALGYSTRPISKPYQGDGKDITFEASDRKNIFRMHPKSLKFVYSFVPWIDREAGFLDEASLLIEWGTCSKIKL